MTTRRLLLVAMAVVGLTVLVPGTASGAPPTSPPPPPSPSSTVTPDPAGEPVPVPVPSPLPGVPGDADVERPVSGESLLPDAGADEYPTSHYDIGYDEGAWNHFSRKALGFFTQLGWTVNRVVVGVVLWMVDWAFGFNLIEPLRGPVLSIAGVWQSELIGPLRLGQLVWFVVVAYSAFQVWRGRALHGLGEFSMSFVALAVASVIGANPAGYLDGAERTLRFVTGAVLAISQGQPPSDDPSLAAQVVDPLRARLHDVLIEEPHEIVNWGRPLTGVCKTTARRLVAEGPWGSSDVPRTLMGWAGCSQEAGFNHNPTAERMASAWMAAMVSVIVLSVLVVAVVAMLVATLFFVLRFASLYLVLLGFQLPGAARRFAWGWLVGLFKDLLTVAGMALVISYLLLASSAFLTTPGMALSERFAAMVITALAMFMFRKRILERVAHLAERMRSELGSLRPGLAGRAAGGWSAPAGAARGMSGYGIGHRARDAMLDIPGSSAYTAAYTGRHARRHQPGAISRPQRHYQRSLTTVATGDKHGRVG